MARLQKKKPASQKKKNRPQASEGSAGGKGADAAAGKAENKNIKSAAPAQGAQEKKVKPMTSSARKAKPAAGQSAVLRLVDRYFGRWIQFLREVKVELSRVTWPSRKQTLGSTVVVLVFVFIIALFLGLIDLGLSSLVRLIL